MDSAVSFVVLTKNNVKTIKNCLESIVQQSYSNFNILVIDGNSNDGTIDIVFELMKKYDKIGIYNVSNLSIGAARQFGVEKADGEYIAFVDSDCELPHYRWLDRMLEPFKNSSVACTWTMGDYKKSFPSIARYTIMSDIATMGVLPKAVIDTNYFTIGMGHTVVKKSIIKELGGFRDLVANEDRDITWRMVKKGYSLIQVDNARVYHLHATS
jgi:glycosyltransferase involved in cell wall biosynthesis